MKNISVIILSVLAGFFISHLIQTDNRSQITEGRDMASVNENISVRFMELENKLEDIKELIETNIQKEQYVYSSLRTTREVDAETESQLEAQTNTLSVTKKEVDGKQVKKIQQHIYDSMLDPGTDITSIVGSEDMQKLDQVPWQDGYRQRMRQGRPGALRDEDNRQYHHCPAWAEPHNEDSAAGYD